RQPSSGSRQAFHEVLDGLLVDLDPAVPPETPVERRRLRVDRPGEDVGAPLLLQASLELAQDDADVPVAQAVAEKEEMAARERLSDAPLDHAAPSHSTQGIREDP